MKFLFEENRAFKAKNGNIFIYIVLILFPIVVFAQHAFISPYVIDINGKSLSFNSDDFTKAAKEIILNSKNMEKSQIGKPTKIQIKKMARKYGLLDESKYNPHLSLLGGDIAYWFEQGVSLNRLNLEFSARKTVLDVADREKFFISDQGILSYAAQSIMAQILKKRQEINEGSKESTMDNGWADNDNGGDNGVADNEVP